MPQLTPCPAGRVYSEYTPNGRAELTTNVGRIKRSPDSRGEHEPVLSGLQQDPAPVRRTGMLEAGQQGPAEAGSDLRRVDRPQHR
jgi:hypothetical protein